MDKIIEEDHSRVNHLIKAIDLGKSYRIYKRKRDRVKQLACRGERTYYDEYWAVRNISLTLRRGDSLGIIGRNGSGKSTLLQLICGTLRPTEGSIERNGRIAALLELGSGFNPEFTGRENVYLNASLLGLSKNETDRRLDDILSFADIGEFIDQPVKTYSSGMTVRLAFSVIANVDADVLVVDEALAVGDAFFTQKCMRFIQRYREENCLLFVSHDATAVLSLCERAILLSNGKARKMGDPKDIIAEYTRDLQLAIATAPVNEEQKPLDASETMVDNKKSSGARKDQESTSNTTEKQWLDFRHEAINASKYANTLEVCRFDENVLTSETFGPDKAAITNVSIHNGRGDNSQLIIMGGEVVTLKIEVTAKTNLDQVIIGFILKNDKGLTLLGDNTLNCLPSENRLVLGNNQRMIAEFVFTLPLLPSGEYSVTASVAEGTQRNHRILHWLNDSIILRSKCDSIAAGMAGVPMQSVKISVLT